MKLTYAYVVVNKQTQETVGYPEYTREMARILKRELEEEHPKNKFAIIRMVPYEVVR